jgi:hypothetical protein
MGRITLDDGRDGLGAFPDQYRVVGRDDLGDVLAVDAQGKVWCFAHGSGDWQQKTAAFDTVARMHEHIAFQQHFESPDRDEDLDALRARKAAIEQFMKGRRDAPYSRRDADGALDDLRTGIEDRRFWASKKGQSLTARQALGARCDQALRDAGAPGVWTCRALADDAKALGVQGTFDPVWTQERVTALLQPLVGALHLRFFERGRPPA